MNGLELSDGEFQKFSNYVHDVSGINLHEGKKELLKARLGKVLRERNFPSFREYYERVVTDQSGHELTILLNSISTNLTQFFREPEHFDLLKKKVLPEIMNMKISSRNNILRFWSAGCSSGEEAYTIAIAVNEVLKHRGKWQFKVLATDLSTKSLSTASAGIYEKEKTMRIPIDLKRRYFQKGQNRWEGYFRVKREIKEKITFQRLNFMERFYFKDLFDAIFCRNVMIYFDNPTKELLIQKFFHSLSEGGYLFIGHAESLTAIKYHLKYIQPSVYQKIITF